MKEVGKMFVGEIFNNKIKNEDLSQTKLAQKLGITRQALSQALKRDISKCSVETLTKLSNAFGIYFDIQKAFNLKK